MPFENEEGDLQKLNITIQFFYIKILVHYSVTFDIQKQI
jgi:hypothetical protein